MSENYILDADGNPQKCDDLLEWARAFEECDRRVADTTVGESRISTVFLGLDHSFGRGAPVLFETMVFGRALDEYRERYSTRAEALAGHETMVARVTATGDGGTKCEHCDKVGTAEAHTCPYKEEIHDDSATLCHCCSECTRECAMDI